MLAVSPSKRVATRKPKKIGRRLYEFTLMDGRKAYRADIQLNGVQRRITLQARNRTEARKAHAELVAKHATGRLIAPTRKTVSEVYDELRGVYYRQVATGERSPRTLEAYDYRIKSRVLPLIGDQPIQRITAATRRRALRRHDP